MVSQVTPSLLAHLERVRAEALRACGVTLEEWRTMSFEQREHSLRQARRCKATPERNRFR